MLRFRLRSDVKIYAPAELWVATERVENRFHEFPMIFADWGRWSLQAANPSVERYRGYGPRDVGCQIQPVLHRGFVTSRPFIPVFRRVHQPRSNPDLLSRMQNCAFQNSVGTEFPSDP